MSRDDADPVPTFVVVGNVNQGKSSVVAALTEDPDVPIDAMPGTTTRAGEYALRAGADGPVVLRLIDTPGFQRARQALAWLRQRADSAADRRRAVRDFVAAHDGGEAFVDEVRLLRPVVEGACILYVVDAHSRFEPSSEAEMEILRWTGQPGLALLNRTGGGDHAEEWRPVLQQFFAAVRSFDAWRADFDDRIALLRSFRELRPDHFAAALDAAVDTLQRVDDDRRRRTATVIADLVVRACSHVERRALHAGDDVAAVRRQLADAHADAQRAHERLAREQVETVWRHRRLQRAEAEVDVLDADLLSDESWRAFGLSRGELARYGALAGGAVGLGVDAAVGGLSGFGGALIGGGVGAVAGFFGTQQLGKVWSEKSGLAKVLLPGQTGRFLALGPVSNPRFAWMLLDRALTHARAVRRRSHARSDVLELGDGRAGVAASFDAGLRQQLDGAVRALLAAARHGQALDHARARLTPLVERALTAPG